MPWSKSCLFDPALIFYELFSLKCGSVTSFLKICRWISVYSVKRDTRPSEGTRRSEPMTNLRNVVSIYHTNGRICLEFVSLCLGDVSLYLYFTWLHHLSKNSLAEQLNLLLIVTPTARQLIYIDKKLMILCISAHKLKTVSKIIMKCWPWDHTTSCLETLRILSIEVSFKILFFRNQWRQ